MKLLIRTPILLICVLTLSLGSCTKLKSHDDQKSDEASIEVKSDDASTYPIDAGEQSNSSITNDGSIDSDTRVEKITCDSDELLCDDSCVPNDEKNCEECGRDCTALEHVTDSVECNEGKCVLTSSSCESDWADCNEEYDDGCETNITEAKNCGSCGRDCSETDQPLCAPIEDDDEYECVEDCPPNAPTLCGDSCVNIEDNPLHCGKCDKECASVTGGKPICEDSKCGFECDDDSHLKCSDGCFPNDDKNCGECGNDCTEDNKVCNGDGNCVSCIPTTCEAENFNCGTLDSCGEILSCGSCDLPDSCGGSGAPNVCGCTPETDARFCERLAKDCEIIEGYNNCGIAQSVNCGECSLPFECGGGGTENVCGCESSRETLDEEGQVGYYTSIDIDSARGIHIAYSGEGKLKYVYRPVDGSWSIPEEFFAGMQPSLAVDTAGGLHIAYYDSTNRDLKYAYHAPLGVWDGINLDTDGFTGQDPSLAVHTDGSVHVAYTDDSDGRLMYIEKPPGNKWDNWSDPIVIDPSGGRYSSLKVAATGEIHVAYFGKEDNLWYVYRNSSGSWSTPATLDDSEDSVGWYASLMIAPDNGLHIAYQNQTKSDLKYVNKPPEGPWADPVTLVSTGEAGKYSSITADSEGSLYIAYWEAFNYNLVYLKKPPDGDWTDPLVIDSEGDVGHYLSIVSGLAVHIAYMDFTKSDLKYAMVCP